jgi:putative tricarboxylic transport membrane protein
MMLGFALAAVGMDTRPAGCASELRLERAHARLRFPRRRDRIVRHRRNPAVDGRGLSFKGRTAKLNLKVVLETWAKLPQYWLTSLRSCLIGCWMGITPGGATPASFMGYGVAKRMSRDGHKFGTGQLEGVVAPETAAHAAGTSALLPMISLGIPGSPTAAVLLGGLLIWGLQPGPLLFVEQKEFVWGLIASMYLGNLAGLIIVLTCVPLFAAILRVPFSIIAPLIIVICAIGAYTVHNAMLDIWFMLLFGVIATSSKSSTIPSRLWCSRWCWAIAPRKISATRSKARRATSWCSSSNGLVATIMTLGLLLLFWPVLSRALSRAPGGNADDQRASLKLQKLRSLQLDLPRRLSRDSVSGDRFRYEASSFLGNLSTSQRVLRMKRATRPGASSRCR